jgi:hypothetical protein
MGPILVAAFDRMLVCEPTPDVGVEGRDDKVHGVVVTINEQTKTTRRTRLVSLRTMKMGEAMPVSLSEVTRWAFPRTTQARSSLLSVLDLLPEAP